MFNNQWAENGFPLTISFLWRGKPPLNLYFLSHFYCYFKYKIQVQFKFKHKLRADFSVEQICDKVKMVVWIFHSLLSALIFRGGTCSNFSNVQNINISQCFCITSDSRLGIKVGTSRFVQPHWKARILLLLWWATSTEPSSSSLSSFFDTCFQPLDLHHISRPFFSCLRCPLPEALSALVDLPTPEHQFLITLPCCLSGSNMKDRC